MSNNDLEDVQSSIDLKVSRIYVGSRQSVRASEKALDTELGSQQETPKSIAMMMQEDESLRASFNYTTNNFFHPNHKTNFNVKKSKPLML